MIRIEQPEHGPRTALVLDSPHSGCVYPADFRFKLDAMTLRRSEDAYVDDLFGAAPAVGGVLLHAEFPRCYIDPNRALDDIDTGMIDGEWPAPVTASGKTARGAGLIWRQVKRYGEIYDRKLTVDEVTRRIEQCWKPYHLALSSLLDAAYERHGRVLHLNCHSMASMGDHTTEDGPVPRPDFILGDLDGRSCAPAYVDAVRDFLQAAGYRVVLNDPYKGQELIRRYSDPAADRHSLQIEINRALYMDEATLARTEGYRRLRETLTSLCARLASLA